MGLLRKFGIILLVYVLVGFVWSVMMHIGYLPPPGGLQGPLNILYWVFMPVSFIYFLILGSLGML